MATSISSNIGHFDDLVFQERNRSYGAFEIRKSYTFNIIMGLVVGMFMIGTVLAIPYVQKWIDGMKKKEKVAVVKNTPVTLTNPESLDEEKKEEIKEVKQEVPQMESVKFTVPIVTTEEVTEVTTIDDLTASNPGTKTQDGIEGFNTMPGDGEGDVIGDTETEDIFTIVEQYPSFPGGDEAWHKFLDDNMQYPTMAREQGITGKVWLNFIVDKFGNVSNVTVVRGIGGGCDEEAARVVSMSPRWNPARQSGRPVNVKYNFPINFALR